MRPKRLDFLRRGIGAAALVSLAMAAGCTQPAPVKGTYVLEPPTPPLVAKPQPGALRIGTATVGAPFRGRGFVFRESDLKYETDYYHEFLVLPAANIGESTARALAAAKVFASVAPAGVSPDSDWVLDLFVDALYGDARTPDKPAAVLNITYFLRRANLDAGVPIWSRTYERRVPFTAGSTGAYTSALNAAFGDILAELSRDLAVAQLGKL